MFPLADARGRVIGFQARKLHDDDPLKGKYVNSPESELFKKSNVLYGLHLARPAIAKQDRAVVVEGNTDVIPLRQAGLEPGELLRAGERVLGEIDPAPLLGDQPVQTRHQRGGPRTQRQIDRDCHSRSGEAQHPLAFGAEILEHRQERRPTQFDHQLEKAPRRSGALALGQDALVLREAAPAVHPVPVLDDVERMEELLR